MASQAKGDAAPFALGADALDLDGKSSSISTLVAALREQVEARPWLDPPKLRQTGEALAQGVAALGRKRRELVAAGRRSAHK